MEINLKAHDKYNISPLELTAKYDKDYKGRQGFDPSFLGIKLSLPKLDAVTSREEIAISAEPGPNGENYLDYTHFSIMFNGKKKLPFFTAVNINGPKNQIAVQHEARGSDIWFQDTRLGTEANRLQFSKEDYKGKNGERAIFQKGHMVRFYDPAWGPDEAKTVAIADTFHYTNCCPQIGRYNAGIWNDLEDYCMARAIFDTEKINVYTGPLFKNARKVDSLLVPVNFWKILAYQKGPKIETLAFLISHELSFQKMETIGLLKEEKLVEPQLKPEDIDRLFTQKNLKKWVVPVKLIEEKTGIDFGLSQFDKNRARDLYEIEYVSDFDHQVEKMKYLMEYRSYTGGIEDHRAKDIELIKSM